MKRFLLFLILPILLSAQPASRISRQDTLRAYLADTIYVKNRFRVNSVARFDSTVTIKGFQVDSTTLNTKSTTQVLTGTKYWTSSQYFDGDSVVFMKQSGSNGTGTGTVTFAEDSSNVYGSGTAFTTELVVGQNIIIDGETYKIASITSNTLLSVFGANVTGSVSGVPFTYTSQKYAQVKYASGVFIGYGDTYSNWKSPNRDKTQNGFVINPSLGSAQFGSASGTQWDSANTGSASLNVGQNNTVSGPASVAIGVSNTNSQTGSFVGGTSNTLSNGSYNLLWGRNLSSSGVNYVNFFGNGMRINLASLGGFGYTDSGGDTVRVGHATVSQNVPFISYYSGATNTPVSGGTPMGAIGLMQDQSADSASDVIQQYLGVNGSAGTTTTSLEFVKFRNTQLSNYNRWDGNKYIVWLRRDTADNVIVNAAKSADETFGYMQLANGDFKVDLGSVDADSLRFNGTTIGTKLAYHSGLGASFWGNITTGTINSGSLTTTGSLNINRASTSAFSLLNYQTASTTKWNVGTRNNATETMTWFYSPQSVTPFQVDTNGTGTFRRGVVAQTLQVGVGQNSALVILTVSNFSGSTKASIDTTGKGTFVGLTTTGSITATSQTISSGAITSTGNSTFKNIRAVDSIVVGAAASTVSGYILNVKGKTNLDSLNVPGKIYASGIPSDSTGLPTGALYFKSSDGTIRRKY